MAKMTEIERKFRVNVAELPEDLSVYPMSIIMQGYLITLSWLTVRFRTRVRWFMSDLPTMAGYITVKGPGLLKRIELEVRIPYRLAAWVIDRCRVKVGKDRFELGRWELDRFFAPAPAPWLAEIELESVSEVFDVPAFIGQEVTHDRRYSNVAIARDGFPRSE